MKLYEIILNNCNTTKAVPIGEYGNDGIANWERFHNALWNWRANNDDASLSECFEASKAVFAPINETLDYGRRICCKSVEDMAYFRELAIVKRKEDVDSAAVLKEVTHYCKAKLGLRRRNNTDSVEFNAACDFAQYVPTEEECNTITLPAEKVKAILQDAETELKALRKAKEARREYVTMSTLEGFRMSAENLISDVMILSADDIAKQKQSRKEAKKARRENEKARRAAVKVENDKKAVAENTATKKRNEKEEEAIKEAA